MRTTYADDLFYKFNADLEKVGLNEFSKTSSAPFKGEIYRLPKDFKLGVGDTLIINLWGKLEDKYTLVIDKDGKILISRVGSVYVIGITMDEAKKKIGDVLNQRYANVQFDVSLGNVQDIRISVLGNVNKPGMYAISPFAKILDALIVAGGPTGNGSLKNVRLIRDNKVIGLFDYYKFVLKGDDSKNITLEHEDKIFIPVIDNLIAIRGEVVRPGIYEINKDTKLSEIIDLASGILPSKFNQKIQIMRLEKITKNIILAKEIVFDDFDKIRGTKDDVNLDYQDTIIITTEHDFSPFAKDIMKMVTVEGEVNNPGRYIIEEGEKLSSVLKRAGGLTAFAYPEGAIFTRRIIVEEQEKFINTVVKKNERDILEEEARLSRSVVFKEEKEILQKGIERRREALNIFASQVPEGRIIINLPHVSEKGEGDILLEKDDILYIPPIPNWVLINGAVYNPGAVVYKEGKGLDYYLGQVGGTTDKANVDTIHIIKPNGSVVTKSSGYGAVSQGDIIVVPEKDMIFENTEKGK